MSSLFGTILGRVITDYVQWLLGIQHFYCQKRQPSKVRTRDTADSTSTLTYCKTEGAALPLAALTAAVGLYSSIKLGLPQPWSPAAKPTPLLIYGASSAVGYYVLQLALKSNLHPLICIAGRASAHVNKLLDKSQGDAIVDYRQSNEDVAKGIKNALKGQKLEYAYDAVSEKGSYQIISEVLDKMTGKITLVLPPKTGWNTDYPPEDIAEGIQQSVSFYRL